MLLNFGRTSVYMFLKQHDNVYTYVVYRLMLNVVIEKLGFRSSAQALWLIASPMDLTLFSSDI